MQGLFYLCVVFVVISALHLSSNADSLADDDDTFVATREWQVVKPGQKVPQGLHVRMNFETGVTEAKILDHTEKSKSSAVLAVEDENLAEIMPNENAGGMNLNLQKHIEDALKKIRPDDPQNEEYARNIKDTFKTYEELKKDLHELNLAPTTDAELLKGLIEKHKEIYKEKDFDEEDILVILEDIEFLVHQFDNALDFVKMDGFKEVVYKNLNSTNSHIKMDALKIFGATLQNNVKTQIYALETGGLTILLKILALDTDMLVKNRALYSLSALLRRFPLAQTKFLENAGLTVFSQLFESNNIKLQIKLTTLIYDLLSEHIEVMKDISSAEYNEKAKQYRKVNFKGKIVDNNYCTYFSELLLNIVAVDSKDYDAIERCLKALVLVIDDCGTGFFVNITDTLLKLLNQFQELSLKEKSKSEDYFMNLHNLVFSIVKQINVKQKSEL